MSIDRAIKKCLLMLLLVLFSTTSFAQLYNRLPTIQANRALEQALLVATNEQRRQYDLNELIFDDDLSIAARYHANEMAVKDYFSHTSPNSLTLTSAHRVAMAGVNVEYVGENNADVGGRSTAAIVERTISGWMDSKGHRANLLDPNYTHVGFGTARDGDGSTLVVQVLAKRGIVLKTANVNERLLNRYEVKVLFELAEDSVARFVFGDNHTEPAEYPSGKNRISFVTEQKGKIFIKAGVESPNQQGFIVQDGGWFQLNTNSFEHDPSAHTDHLKIESISSHIKRLKYYAVDIVAGIPKEKKVVIIVNNSFLNNVEVISNRYKFFVAVEETEPTILLGLEEGDKVVSINAFTIVKDRGRPRFVPLVAR